MLIGSVIGGHIKRQPMLPKKGLVGSLSLVLVYRKYGSMTSTVIMVCYSYDYKAFQYFALTAKPFLYFSANPIKELRPDLLEKRPTLGKQFGLTGPARKSLIRLELGKLLAPFSSLGEWIWGFDCRALILISMGNREYNIDINLSCHAIIERKVQTGIRIFWALFMWIHVG